MVRGAEVGDLGGHAAAERRGVEPGDGADRGPPRAEALPQPVGAGADGGHAADAGDDDPPRLTHELPLSAAPARPASVRCAMWWMNSGPITRLAAGTLISGQAGPSHQWLMVTSMPPGPGSN